MSAVDELRATFPDAARDIRLNLESVLQTSSLTPAQMWGVAVASAIATRNPRLRAAVVADAQAVVPGEVVEDAMAAATLMAMNNVYYRFRHLSGKEIYSQLPARLRMQRIARPATNKGDFELFCLAVSAINACEACIRSHEAAVLHGGLSEENVHDAVRIAATLSGAAVAEELAAMVAVEV